MPLGSHPDLLLRQGGLSPRLVFNGVYWQTEVWIGGNRYENALGMHPDPSGSGFAEFRIPTGAKLFRGRFGLARQDSQPNAWGDAEGRVAWLTSPGGSAATLWSGRVSATRPHFDLEITLPPEARVLRLEVDGLGSVWSDHTTWGDPQFASSTGP